MSILEIEKLAGVTHTAVARVINNEDNVYPEKAAKIKAIMKKAGYVPKSSDKRCGPRRLITPSIKTGNVAFPAAYDILC